MLAIALLVKESLSWLIKVVTTPRNIELLTSWFNLLQLYSKLIIMHTKLFQLGRCVEGVGVHITMPYVWKRFSQAF